MKRVVVREYDWLGTVPESGFPVNLSDTQVSVLGSMERSWARGALEWGRDRVRFAGFCGTIKLGTDYFDILPKITEEEDPSIDRSLLVRMLRIVSSLQLSTGDDTQASMQDVSILDILIELFCRTIRDSARRGLPHAYTAHSDNLRALRGKIRVSHQIRHNICHPEMLFCDFEEFQEDNALNQILKAALTIAGRHAGSPGTRISVQSLLDLFIDVSDVPASKLRWAGLEQDRRYIGWKTTLTQARWFIEGECPNIYSGKNDSICILFDMAKLFERYVAIEVGNLLSPAGYSVQCQGPFSWLLSREDMSRYKTIPDIFVTKNGLPAAILDTKWKVLMGNAGEADMAQSDLYQLFAYAKAYHVSDVALIYPSSYGQVLEYGYWKYMDGLTSLYIIRVDISTLKRGRQEFRDELSRSGLDHLLAHAEEALHQPIPIS
jgi:5-methylcytosine-specific restriction enzyme subunit McrC